MNDFEIDLRRREGELLRVLEEERKRAIREGRPYAVPCKLPLEWCGGAPKPALLQSEDRTFLIFFLDGRDTRVGRVEFHQVWSAQFGEPNEEGIMNHSLIGSGFDGFSPVEVIGSKWVEEMLERVPVASENFDGRHFIFPFHDSTFECVADSFSASELEIDYKKAIRESAELL